MNISRLNGDYIESLLNKLVNKYDMTLLLLLDLFGVEESKLKNYIFELLNS